jgi:hypothetical protein
MSTGRFWCKRTQKVFVSLQEAIAYKVLAKIDVTAAGSVFNPKEIWMILREPSEENILGKQLFTSVHQQIVEGDMFVLLQLGDNVYWTHNDIW